MRPLAPVGGGESGWRQAPSPLKTKVNSCRFLTPSMQRATLHQLSVAPLPRRVGGGCLCPHPAPPPGPRLRNMPRRRPSSFVPRRAAFAGASDVASVSAEEACEGPALELRLHGEWGGGGIQTRFVSPGATGGASAPLPPPPPPPCASSPEASNCLLKSSQRRTPSQATQGQGNGWRGGLATGETRVQIPTRRPTSLPDPDLVP